MKTRNSYLTILIILFCSFSVAKSQTQDSTGITTQKEYSTKPQVFEENPKTKTEPSDETQVMKERPFHLAFITPMGTNGMESGKIVNNFSLNLFAGYSGGLKGVEIGGFSNILLEKMEGLQIAGFSNSNFGDSKGAQISGFYNGTKGYFEGLQSAGFANAIYSDAQVAQIAGFSNFTLGSLTGCQIAGFNNYTKNEMKGIQVAGFANYAGGDSFAQISGFVNTVTGNIEGIQVAGFSNFASGNVKGAQISGFINVAKNVKGTQIGVINIADSISNGVPIGFLSFVKSGYHAFEVSSNELLYANVAVKTGTNYLYNIISLGSSVKNNEIIWAWGYGLGTRRILSERSTIAFEATNHHINEDRWFSGSVNNLSKLSLTYSYNIGNIVDIFVGPSFNVAVDNINRRTGETNDFVPYHFFNKNYSSTNVKMYAGITAGIRF